MEEERGNCSKPQVVDVPRLQSVQLSDLVGAFSPNQRNPTFKISFVEAGPRSSRTAHEGCDARRPAFDRRIHLRAEDVQNPRAYGLRADPHGMQERGSRAWVRFPICGSIRLESMKKARRGLQLSLKAVCLRRVRARFKNNDNAQPT